MLNAINKLLGRFNMASAGPQFPNSKRGNSCLLCIQTRYMSHCGKAIVFEVPGVQTEPGFQNIINTEPWLHCFLRAPHKKDLEQFTQTHCFWASVRKEKHRQEFFTHFIKSLPVRRSRAQEDALFTYREVTDSWKWGTWVSTWSYHQTRAPNKVRCCFIRFPLYSGRRGASLNITNAYTDWAATTVTRQDYKASTENLLSKSGLSDEKTLSSPADT